MKRGREKLSDNNNWDEWRPNKCLSNAEAILQEIETKPQVGVELFTSKEHLVEQASAAECKSFEFFGNWMLTLSNVEYDAWNLTTLIYSPARLALVCVHDPTFGGGWGW